MEEFDHPLDADALPQAISGADLVLLCVPVTAMREVVAVMAPHLSPETILADICSLKIAPLETMLAATHTPVAGTHPLFGPETAGPDLRVALVPGRDRKALENLSHLFRALGFSTFTTTAEEHDQAMSYVQGAQFRNHRGLSVRRAVSQGYGALLHPVPCPARGCGGQND